MAKEDRTQLTGREKRKVQRVEDELRKGGVPPHQAEQQALDQVASGDPDGKRKKNHTYKGHAKSNSNSTPKVRRSNAR